jgi:hypothetical protein
MTTSLRSWYWLAIGVYSGIIAGILFCAITDHLPELAE